MIESVKWNMRKSKRSKIVIRNEDLIKSEFESSIFLSFFTLFKTAFNIGLSLDEKFYATTEALKWQITTDWKKNKNIYLQGD